MSSVRHRLSLAANGKWWALVGPYDRELVHRLVALVPGDAREWRPLAKLWRIAPEYADAVRGLLADLERERDEQE